MGRMNCVFRLGKKKRLSLKQEQLEDHHLNVDSEGLISQKALYFGL